MTSIKQNTTADECLPHYLNSYHRLNKTDKSNWYDDGEIYSKGDKSLQTHLSQISIIKVVQPKNMVIQKRETGNTYSFRIAIGRKSEERFIGVLPDNANWHILIIKPSRKPFVEVFICGALNGDNYAFFKKLESGELEAEIKWMRLKFANNKAEVTKLQPE